MPVKGRGAVRQPVAQGTAVAAAPDVIWVGDGREIEDGRGILHGHGLLDGRGILDDRLGPRGAERCNDAHGDEL